MDICFKPSDVTLDLINICLEKPFITESQLMNKSQTVVCISSVKQKVVIRGGGGVGEGAFHAHTSSFLDFKMMHVIRTIGSSMPQTLQAAHLADGRHQDWKIATKGRYPALSEIRHLS